jgi:hypothetical protein
MNEWQKQQNESKASGRALNQCIKSHDTQNDNWYDCLISNKLKIMGITLKFILITKDK